ncbi:MAG: DDE-type integrase/transposase/recombinase [Gammaproteobacteria bacterium]|nr:DDE-type integrase/transposase/recombinase [Gammaproteobacteria bacterium]
MKEIRTAENTTFSYVPSQDNPADLATRGMSSNELQHSSLWWHGPVWLKQHPSTWPTGNICDLSPETMQQVSTEVRHAKPLYETSVTVVTIQPPVNSLLDIKEFSSLMKLLLTTVFIFRFIKGSVWDKLSPATHQKFSLLPKLLPNLSLSGPVHYADICKARYYWEYCVQRVCFSDIFSAIHSNKSLPIIKQLGLQVDSHGLLRCHGRLKNSQLPWNARFPILLPEKHYFTTLVIRFHHLKSLHSGVQQTLASIRQNYWLICGRRAIKQEISSCVTCLKHTGGPFILPPMAPLPKARVSRARPFQFIGLDYTGPLYIKLNGERLKVWICLFTCYVVRAVHLDIVMDLSAVEFLNCLRRFIARRGLPEKITSDNAATFKLVCSTMDKAWRQIFTDDSLTSYCNSNAIQWNFITELSPWQGGMYERLIGLTKNSLKKAVGRRQLDYSQLSTLLTEVEGVLNSRPLTFLYSDLDSNQMLRPIDFLNPHGMIGSPTFSDDHTDPDWTPPSLNSCANLLRFWTTSQTELDQFWTLWQQEYLASLRERFQHSHHHSRIVSKYSPHVGDIVLVGDSNLPRGHWKYGRITQLNSSNDGAIRSAELLLPNHNRLKRSLNMLYPLEVCAATPEEIPPSTPQPTPMDTQPAPQQNVHRPVTRSITRSMTNFVSGISNSLLFFICLFTLFGQTQAFNPENWLLYEAFGSLIDAIPSGAYSTRSYYLELIWLARTFGMFACIRSCRYCSGAVIAHLGRSKHASRLCKAYQAASKAASHGTDSLPLENVLSPVDSPQQPLGRAFVTTAKTRFSFYFSSYDCRYFPSQAIRASATIFRRSLIGILRQQNGTSRRLLNICITILILTSFIAPVYSQICPADKNLQKVESQYCQAEGIVVYRSKVTQRLCYKRVTCPTGHLDGLGNCGPKCPCPSWADGCSYHHGSEPKTVGIKETILTNSRPNFCSLLPDHRCNDKPTHVRVHQIQLYDGTLHHVRQLEIHQTEATAEEYQCIGLDSSIMGTPEFCLNHGCSALSKRFCYYKANGPAYFITPDGRLPVKAWGSIPIKYFGPKDRLPESPTCLDCSLKCIQGGVELSLPPNIGQVEVCSKPYCYRLSNPDEITTILFPKETNIQVHDFRVKVWANGVMIRDFGIQCEPQPFCEMIQCYLCLSRIGNPQCAPKMALFLIFLMAYFSSMTIYVGIKILKTIFHGFYYCSRCSFFCSRAILKFLFKTRNAIYHITSKDPTPSPINNTTAVPTAETTSVNLTAMRPISSSGVSTPSPGQSTPTTQLYIPPHRRNNSNRAISPNRFSSLKTMIYTISILHFFLPGTLSCAEVTSLTASRSVCTVSQSGAMECLLSESTRLSLVPQGQDSCLLVRDPNGEPMGTLAIEVERITLECQMKNDYYTRSFEMKVSASKRCPNAGSCDGNKCGDVTVTSSISELGSTANNAPGFTYCMESCGCAACDCFYCTYACLFYRTYASPTSDVTFEVFSCPIWQYKVRATARLTLKDSTKQQDFILRPGRSVQWNNLKLTLISITSPPVPILGSQFVTDGSTTLMIRASASGQPVSGTVGSLQCGTREKAQNFQCYLPHDSCNCQGQGEEVSCTCVDMAIEPLFKKLEHVIPLTTEGLDILGSGHDLEAEYDSIASLEIQVTLEGFKLSTQIDKNKCTIQPLAFGGCYACLTGAKLNFNCKTDFGEAIAHVTCGTAAFSTVCSPSGVKGVATLNYPKAHIQENCVVNCPAGISNFRINGNLVFIEKERIGNLSNIRSEDREKTGNYNLDVGFLASWFSGNWLAGIGVIIFLIIIIVITVPLTPVIINYLSTHSRHLFQNLKNRIHSKPFPTLSLKSKLAKFRFKKRN